jgi:hypothetical protein
MAEEKQHVDDLLAKLQRIVASNSDAEIAAQNFRMIL